MGRLLPSMGLASCGQSQCGHFIQGCSLCWVGKSLPRLSLSAYNIFPGSAFRQAGLS